MRMIPLSQGMQALVDDCDYEYLSQFKWHAQWSQCRCWYAKRWTPEGVYLMHREILGLSGADGLTVDHIDRDGCNNTRSNLRVCSQTENARNVGLTKTNRSGFKGVYWKKSIRRWIASIRINAKTKHLGSFNSKEDAALAYDIASRERDSKFGVTNASLGLIDSGRVPIKNKTQKHSDLPGVSFRRGRWVAFATFNGKSHYLGVQPSEREAHEAHKRFMCQFQ